MATFDSVPLDADVTLPATGSGPFRFLADEFVSGAHAAYARGQHFDWRDNAHAVRETLVRAVG